MSYAVSIALFDNIALGIAAPVLAYYGGKVTNAICDHLHFATDSVAATRVAAGVNALEQYAFNALSGVAAHNQTVQIRSDAVAKAMGNITSSMAKAMVRLNVTPDQIAQRVQGAMAARLATGTTTVTNYLPAATVSITDPPPLQPLSAARD